MTDKESKIRISITHDGGFTIEADTIENAKLLMQKCLNVKKTYPINEAIR